MDVYLNYQTKVRGKRKEAQAKKASDFFMNKA